ncbi:pyridoxamine phosphate oxidase family protein [Moniliophthora roreri MCA 2997]|uniref:Pyridoxamine phosphate oxidase family protein n=1 Tax=Moniliophthora roreri (strain MCA 2997) TaxID=1381753 RepID=V2XJZ4_MONRO|nr:pyridoxamine phosphate oxidase family protein [Moniliophthora roreri MCA 2997]
MNHSFRTRSRKQSLGAAPQDEDPGQAKRRLLFVPEVGRPATCWIRDELFWVATAPLSATFPVKELRELFMLITGRYAQRRLIWGHGRYEGCETISHIRENGRITVYFNAFEGPPRIARLFGKGTVYEFETPEYNDLIPPEKRKPGSRSVIMVDVHKVAKSCGYAIPFFESKSHWNKLIQWVTPKEKGLKAYWAQNNSTSLDGLPGMNLLLQTTDTQLVGPVAQRMRGRAGQLREAPTRRCYGETGLLKGGSSGYEDGSWICVRSVGCRDVLPGKLLLFIDNPPLNFETKKL